MTRELVFAPVASTELAAIAGEIDLIDREVIRVSPGLLAALELDAADQEEAEYAALQLAGVLALSRYGHRNVLVAEIPEDLLGAELEPQNGLYLARSIPRAAMTCWFSDDPATSVTEAARAANGLDIDAAWEQPAVQGLLNQADLLWNDVVEYTTQGG